MAENNVKLLSQLGSSIIPVSWPILDRSAVAQFQRETPQRGGTKYTEGGKNLFIHLYSP